MNRAVLLTCGILLIFAGVLSLAGAEKPDPPATKDAARLAKSETCKIEVVGAAANVDRSPRILGESYPPTFLANISLKLDNSAGKKPRRFVAEKGVVRDSHGKDHHVEWLNTHTGAVWDGKVPAGKNLQVTLFARIEPEPVGPVIMLIQLEVDAMKKTWLRSNEAQVIAVR